MSNAVFLFSFYQVLVTGTTVNGDVFQVSKILSLKQEGLTAWVSVTFGPHHG